MDEQKRTDEQEQEQEQKIDDLEVPDEQGHAVKGGTGVEPEDDGVQTGR